jgi:SSS family solute:Na+ symporter
MLAMGRTDGARVTIRGVIVRTHASALDLLVLAGYFILTMGVGFAVSRRSRSVEGFTAADRNLPGWLTGLSILGTYVSSITFLALPAKAYAANWNPFVFSLSLPLATWIAVRWFLPFYRRTGHVSAYHHLEARFGPWARTYASFCYLLTQLARMGTVMYLMALPMSALLGWDVCGVILLTGVSVTIYSLAGGIVAVIYTDAIQTIVLVVGAVVCAAVMLFALPEGPGQLIGIAAAHDKFSLGSFGPGLGESTFWVVLVYGIAINLQNFGIDQNYIQRYLASKSDRDARRSVWLGGLTYLPLSALFLFIGTALFAFYTAHADMLPSSLRDPSRVDSVFPWFIVSALPPGVSGLVIAAIFAAAMSTISTCLNSSATVLLTDYYRRFLNPHADERRSMRVLRVTTVVWGLAGTAAAVAMTSVRSALDAWWTLAGIFGGGTLGVFLLGFVSRRATNRSAAAGVAAGVVLIIWMTLSPRLSAIPAGLRSPFHEFLVIVFGTAVVLAVGLAFGRRATASRTKDLQP